MIVLCCFIFRCFCQKSMNTKSVGIAAAICAVVGVSAIFLLNTDNTSDVFENNQEISKLDIPTTFSEPIKISQSIETVSYTHLTLPTSDLV